MCSFKTCYVVKDDRVNDLILLSSTRYSTDQWILLYLSAFLSVAFNNWSYSIMLSGTFCFRFIVKSFISLSILISY